MEELVRQGGKIHSAGSLKEAVPVRDEIRRLQSVALAVGDDPMARQMDIEATAGSYAGERPFGRAANLPSTRPRKPTDADMGPHNWGGGEARPKGGKMRGRRRGGGFSPLPRGEGGGGGGGALDLGGSRREGPTIFGRELSFFNRLRCHFLPGRACAAGGC